MISILSAKASQEMHHHYEPHRTPSNGSEEKKDDNDEPPSKRDLPQSPSNANHEFAAVAPLVLAHGPSLDEVRGEVNARHRRISNAVSHTECVVVEEERGFREKGGSSECSLHSLWAELNTVPLPLPMPLPMPMPMPMTLPLPMPLPMPMTLPMTMPMPMPMPMPCRREGGVVSPCCTLHTTAPAALPPQHCSDLPMPATAMPPIISHPGVLRFHWLWRGGRATLQGCHRLVQPKLTILEPVGVSQRLAHPLLDHHHAIFDFILDRRDGPLRPRTDDQGTRL